MTVIERKVCMLGAAGVGKTSLVRRLVEGLFSGRYLSTVGVKVDRKSVPVGDDQVNMILRDIEGATELAGWSIVRTSAATGAGVGENFRLPAGRLVPEMA
jgi:hypothetical protein